MSKIEIQYNDAGGQEQFRFLYTSFMKGTQLTLLAFDLSKEDSIDKAIGFADDARAILGENVPMVVVGTKLDLVEDDDNNSKAENLMDMVGADDYFLTSSKSGEGISGLINYVLETVSGMNPKCISKVKSLPTYKVSIIGPSEAGKTTLVNREITGEFWKDIKSTVAAEFFVKAYEI